MKLSIIYIIILFLPLSLEGQDRYSVVESELDNLFTRLISAKDDIARQRLNDSICGLIEEYAESRDIFTHSFNNLRYLGQITSPDSLLKIINWNLVLENFRGKYFSYLIMKAGDGKNKIIPMSASYRHTPGSEDTTYSDSDWYGALYYGIKPVTSSAGKYWVVLGLDYGNPAMTRKLIDVISIDEKDSVVFGKKWFETTEGMKYRRIFEYASTGMMILRFSSDTSIVFDHLVPIASETNDNQVYYGPDYSYDSYTYNNGIWQFRLNVDARNIE